MKEEEMDPHTSVPETRTNLCSSAKRCIKHRPKSRKWQPKSNSQLENNCPLYKMIISFFHDPSQKYGSFYDFQGGHRIQYPIGDRVNCIIWTTCFTWFALLCLATSRELIQLNYFPWPGLSLAHLSPSLFLLFKFFNYLFIFSKCNLQWMFWYSSGRLFNWIKCKQISLLCKEEIAHFINPQHLTE